MTRLKVQRAVDLATDRIREQILEGEPAIGDLLPPERQLAEQLGINRHTLRGALARLQAEGLLRIRQGSGARVRDYRESCGLELVGYLPDDAQNRLLRGFLEMKRALAVEAMALASERATESHLATLDALAQQQSTEQDRQRFIERDIEFARQMLRAADNLPLELLLNSLIRLNELRPDIPQLIFADLDTVRVTYPLAVSLIRQADAATIRDTVRPALELVDAQTLERLEGET